MNLIDSQCPIFFLKILKKMSSLSKRLLEAGSELR